jgi:hypothetical protein
MAKLQDGTRIYGTANVDTALNVNTYFTANASQVKIGSPLSSNGSTGTAGQILVSGGANNAYWGSTTPLYNYSAQFNGSSSYLSIPTNTVFDYGSGNFTIEGWIYLTGYSPAYTGSNYAAAIINKDGSGSVARSLTFQLGGTASSWTSINCTIFTNDSTLVNTAGTYNFSLNTWYHVAAVRISGTVTMYVNGVSVGSGSNPGTPQVTSIPLTVGFSNYTGGFSLQYWFPGYISNLRIVKGVGVYTGAFTPPTSPLTTSQSSGTNIAAVSSSQVSLLTCNALTLTDSSPNAHVITNNGPVVASATTYPTSFPQSAVYVPTTALTAIRQQFTGDGSTTQFNISGGYTPNTISVFVNGVLARNGSDVTVTSGSFITFTGITPPNGSLIDVTGTVPTTYSSITPVSYSVGFASASSQYLSIPANAAFQMTGDFTIEFFGYNTSFASNPVILDQYVAGTTGAGNWQIGFTTAGVLTFYYDGNSSFTCGTCSTNTWYHIAATRSGSSIKVFVNGVQTGSVTFAGTVGRSDTTMWIGGQHAGGPTLFPNGYFSNVRFVKGVAVYTGNFTVPQSPLQATQIYGGPTIQAITGTQTSLLTCNAPTIVDGSTNAFTITNNGAATVSTSIVPTFTNIVMNSTSADAYNSSTGNLGIMFNNTTNRQMLNAFGFQFRDDGGIITPTNKTKVSFYNEAANTWTVPTGVTRIFVKMWGAGGGGGSYGGWRQGAQAGGGGFTHAMFNVVPGEIIQIRPGGRGTDRPGATAAYPDGGGASTGGGDNQYCSNGGGSSSIRIPSISATVYALYAGGGGGGAASNSFAVNNGGAGGGLIGQPGGRSGNLTTTQYGLGGTQSAGGAGGTGAYTNGAAGTAGQGGTHPNTNCYGGGGGGGYYGGGSGAYNNTNSMGGGGGGSGYVHPSAIFGATYTGSYRTPANSQDSDLQPDNALQYGHGGDESAQGGPGVVVFYY